MRTSEVCAALNCTSRTVFSLRKQVYPEGHPRAGQRVLGIVTFERSTWYYDPLAIREYRDWILAGKPVAPVAPSPVDRSAIAARARRSMA